MTYVRSGTVVRIAEARPNDAALFEVAYDKAMLLRNEWAVRRIQLLAYLPKLERLPSSGSTAAGAAALLVAAVGIAMTRPNIVSHWAQAFVFARVSLLPTLAVVALVLSLMNSKAVATEQLGRRVEQVAREALSNDQRLSQAASNAAAVGQKETLLGALISSRLMGRYAQVTEVFDAETEWCVD